MKLKLLFITIALFVVCGSYGQGTLSSPIFSENFGTLVNTNVLTTSNTAFSFIRVGTSTTGTPPNEIIAKNPSSFTESSGLIGAKGGSISTVDKTGLTSFSSGTFTFKFKTPSSFSSAVMFSGVGTGASFGSANGFTGAQLSSAFQVNGTDLQIRANGAWVTAQTVSPSTAYTIVIVFNNTAGSLNYGNGNVLNSNKCHLWIDGSYIGEYTAATSNYAASAFRIYTTTTEFEVDDIAVYNSLPAASGPTSVASGDWNTASTWSTGSVPTSTDNVTISTAHIVYSSTALTRTGTTTVNGGFELRAGGWASGTNFTYGATGTLILNQSSGGSYGVNNGDVFWPTTNSPFNVTNSGQGLTMNSMTRTVTGTFQTAAGVNLSSSTLTFNGVAQINAGGFFNQSPIYGNASTLIYNTGGTFGRGNEWQALGVGTIGTTAGYPNNIQLTGNTTLNYNNGTPFAKAINGNLTINSGSNFYMDFGGGASGGALTVAGNVANNGNFTLGNAVGDDLRLGGNFTNTGTFNGNNRAVFFTKAGTQIVTSLSGITIPYVVLSGGTTVQLATGTNMLISAPNEGNAISFTNSSDVFDINIGNTLTIGTATKANTISSVGTFKGSTTSNLALLGTGSVGTLTFATNLNLGTFTMNRQVATLGCTMGSDVTINTALNLTNGIIDLGSNTMTLASTCSNTFGDSANSFVISDKTAGGNLRKNITLPLNTTYRFPVGDKTGTIEYSPATVTFTAGSFTSAYLGISVEDFALANSQHSSLAASTDYISRYWALHTTGTFTSPTYTVTADYFASDVNGTETNCASTQLNASTWTDGSSTGVNTLTFSGIPTTPSTNYITKGKRDQEIRVERSTLALIPSGSAANAGYDTVFASQTLSTTSGTKTYTIRNIGLSNLTLSNPTLTGTNPGDFNVSSASSLTIAAGGTATFTITFSPTMTGTRTATISIPNNDSDENPYTFNVEGTGTCTTTTNTITPTSGPVGTEVTITATANNLTGATVSFNGVAATSITYVSSTQIKVIVPSGASSGNLVTTNVIGCSSTNTFTVIKNVGNSCEGGSLASNLFISEVTDSNYGGLTYIEIYNGTGVTKNLSGYSINTASNGGSYSGAPLILNNVNLASGSIYIIALGDDNLCSSSGGDGSLATQISVNFGINFDAYQTGPLKGNDHIALFNGTTQIDSWGVFGDPSWATSTLSIFATETDGATFRRKNTATLPSTTYNNSDWDIIDYIGTKIGDCANNDYSDIGTYNFISGTPPTVTTHPSYTPTCKATTLTVAGTEGYTGGNSLTYKWLVSAPNATGWTELSDTGIYSGTSTATLSIANISGVIDYQYYCQIRENTNTCYSASNAVKIANGSVATWNGSWTNGPPTLDKLVIINADYDTSMNGSFDACSVIVNSLYTLTITANEYVKIQNDLANNGTLDIENNGSLVQINDSGINTGNIRYERTTPDIFRTDYTYWSSPVAGYTLGGVSQNLTLGDKYYSYDSSTEDWKQESSTTTMLAGTGYIIRGPETPFQNPFDAFFVGVPNNGVFPLSGITPDKSYLLGNPYPSALDADTFLDANSNVLDGTLYFWTHKTPLSLATSIPNPGPGWAYTYSLNDYAAYNPVGGVGIDDVAFLPGGSPAPNGSAKPTGKIASGQGFFASSKTAISGSDIVFNNSMRVGVGGITGNNNQFFKTRNPTTKTALIEKHRIWLNLKNTQGAFKQTLIGYITNATNEYDCRFDGVSFDANEFVDFYSVNQDKNLVIQGRALPFNENDEVSLGFRTTIEGDFTINIDQVDGVLTNQSVFIEDKLTNTVFDLKSGNYTFNTVAGTFNDRFILRFTNKTLGTADLETLENQVLVSNKNKLIKINSAVETIDKVTVYDLLGRQIFKKEKVNSNELTLNNFTSSQQTLLVKVTLQNGQTVTRKIIY